MAKRVTTEEFISRAREAHGDRYDYSHTKYVASKNKVEIICREHGVFLQTPGNHLDNKRGCPECGGSKRLDTATFVKRAKNKHGDRYDYSGSEYVNGKTNIKIVCREHGPFFASSDNHIKKGSGCPRCSGRSKTSAEFAEEAAKTHPGLYQYKNVEHVNATTKVSITCPIHDDFLQTPNSHLNGHGCPSCGGSQQLTAETFKARAIETHGDRYDYSRVDYISSQEKVVILCPKHGAFTQSPNKHMSGRGCPRCATEAMGDSRRLDKEEFLKRAVEVHGETYDYSEIEYKDTKTPVHIRCPIHGVFQQQPTSHMSGSGCAKCASVAKKTTEDFINEAREAHGDAYDYSSTAYTGALEKVTITCLEHGEFHQVAVSHLRAQGCPSCASTGFDPEKPGIVYYLRIDRENHPPLYKIGITNRSVDERFPYASDRVLISVIQVWEFDTGSDAYALESEIIRSHPHARYFGKPVLNSGNTELFTDDILGLDGGTGSIHLAPLDGKPLVKQAKSTQQYVTEVRARHGGKYDYSEVAYRGWREKVTIICPVHGPFLQAPTKHRAGDGCPACGGTVKPNTDEFIERARAIHGDLFDYSEVEYVNAREKIRIICREHGPYEQTPSGHYKHSGCPKCRARNISTAKKSNST